MVLTWILLGHFLDLWFQHSHACRREVALALKWIDGNLQYDGDEQQHDTHVDAESCHEVEDVEHDEAVDVLYDWPSEVNEALEVEVFVALTQLFVFSQC